MANTSTEVVHWRCVAGQMTWSATMRGPACFVLPLPAVFDLNLVPFWYGQWAILKLFEESNDTTGLVLNGALVGYLFPRSSYVHIARFRQLSYTDFLYTQAIWIWLLLSKSIQNAWIYTGVQHGW
ncbi:hypothetical protein BC629DRAFT_1434938 [Irpex lacteus]|nr:hypothetical protein BC629DRAFT_1434938 [Irpex lacteus]